MLVRGGVGGGTWQAAPEGDPIGACLRKEGRGILAFAHTKPSCSSGCSVAKGPELDILPPRLKNGGEKKLKN